jgi:hypothetical protein
MSSPSEWTDHTAPQYSLAGVCHQIAVAIDKLSSSPCRIDGACTVLGSEFVLIRWYLSLYVVAERDDLHREMVRADSVTSRCQGMLQKCTIILRR